MYTKEEAKEFRVAFWDQFREFTNKRRKGKGRTGKWILDKTGINALNLRFHFDEVTALVGIDIETRNLDKRLEMYEKLESTRSQINKALGENTIWELEYIRENEKAVSRIYTAIEDVSILDRQSWNRVNMFFFDRMTALEDYFLEYKDYLRYS
jgi:hypothetical protein